MTTVASLVVTKMKFAWWQQMWWAGGCLQTTHAEVNRSVFAFQLLLGNRHSPARSQTSDITDLLKQFLSCRGGCITCTQIAVQYTEVAMAALYRYTLHKKAVMSDHTDCLFVCLKQKTCSQPGNCGAEQILEYNTYPYISLLKSIVRLHLTVELGLKHLGNNLHITSTTTSLPPPPSPFPPAVQSKPTS